MEVGVEVGAKRLDQVDLCLEDDPALVAQVTDQRYVLEGQVGALLGEEVLIGGPGDLIFKPRGQWHTFWNAGDEPARILEIIAPAGFERFFEELVDLGGVAQADPQAMGALCARYELEMDPDSVPGLVERFGVRLGEPAA